MREAISIAKKGNQFVTLSDPNLRKLQQANFLFHAALNSGILSCSCNMSKIPLELCTASFIRFGLRSHITSTATWKLRPKLHKSQSCNGKLR